MGQPQQQAEARQHAMLLLARREHARFELVVKLSAKGFESSHIESTLNSLESENLLSDKRFAECYIRSRVNKGYGPYRIRMELQARQVDDEIVNELLYHGWDWGERIIEVRRKRFGDVPVTDIKMRAKQQRFLQYRGFSSEQINAAIRQDD
ncbi:MAG: recombination regulator RecX [Gammaproteobacteria bacterium]|nr:recombination regulator RecX [Gammaproteobacteria bacterium]MCF6231432.1 recombination regulator RecX [Gammaproteobacteria bacterium]